MNVYGKLLQIQSELKAPKSQYNSFGKYYYRNCEDIQEAVKPLLAKYSCALIVGDEVIQVGERFYIKATARLVDIDSAEEITNSASAREEDSKKGMDGSQVTGTSSSYARKYALNGLFSIDDSKDADNDGKADDKDKLLKEFKEEISRTKKSVSYFVGNAKVTKIEDMNANDLKEAINMLKQCPTKE